MRVLLLNPVLCDGTRSLRIGRCQGRMMVGLWPNIEYGYLAALLAADRFQAVLLDANLLRLGFEQMIERSAALRPDIVFLLGITASVPDDIEAGRRLQARLPGVRLVFWGTHATVRPDDYLRSAGEGSFCIAREPELTGLELCRDLRQGGDGSEVAGVVSRIGGAPAKRPLAVLDRLPFPSHAAMRTGDYLATDSLRPFALIRTSRGCPHRCLFCTVHVFHGGGWRRRTPESVVEEMSLVHRDFGVTDFFLQSDVFSYDREWTAGLCDEIARRQPGVTWFCNSRVDTVDHELLRLMRRAGCRLVAFGVESGSDEVLAACGKGTTADRAAAAIEGCRRAGLRSLTYWVFGLPGETIETMERTLRFVRRTRPDYAHFYSPTPLPGSRLYVIQGIDRLFDEGSIAWRDFFQGAHSRHVAPGLDPAVVRRAVRRAGAEFYLDPRRLLGEAASLRHPRQLAGRASTLATMFANYVARQ